MRVAVLGHVEWVEFVRVDRLPLAGEIIEAVPVLAVAAGGGAVAAVQLARWGVETTLFTAFGEDALGGRAREELLARGVRVCAATRDVPQRRAITFIDGEGERTIVLTGRRLAARAIDPLPWNEFASFDAVYVTAGDADAVRSARNARIVVATSRVLPLLRESNVRLDALVGSDADAAERYTTGDLLIEPALVVRTQGARGGHHTTGGGAATRYAAVPATVTGDTYGAGDTFAAALTFALAKGRTATDAVAFAAARAAEIVTFEGPYPPNVAISV